VRCTDLCSLFKVFKVENPLHVFLHVGFESGVAQKEEGVWAFARVGGITAASHDGMVDLQRCDGNLCKG
jgi:hypothetical protein